MEIWGFTRLALAGRANPHNPRNHNNLEKTQNFLPLYLTGSKKFAIIHTWEEGDILPHPAKGINYSGVKSLLSYITSQGRNPVWKFIREVWVISRLRCLEKSEALQSHSGTSSVRRCTVRGVARPASLFYLVGEVIQGHSWLREGQSFGRYSLRMRSNLSHYLLGLDDLIAFSFTSKPIYLTFDFLSVEAVAKIALRAGYT